ncbi:MAG: B12-binding domain-containing radical SAM protein [Flavisolibacter sp.]
MKILLVYPAFPRTFWSFKYALKFISKRATHPPLGLLTIAAMLPEQWEKKLVDMNVERLKEKDLEGVDFVFISAMSIQLASVKEVVERCKKMRIKMVAGGPLFTGEYQDFHDVDHLVLNEAEITLPLFLADLEKGCAKHLYTTKEFADIERTTVPLWSLIKMRRYSSISLQYSRGCPYNCEFCEISALFGHRVRTKAKEQVIMELESLYRQGWRGNVFFVDDNFIGNKKKLKSEVLPAVNEWAKARKHPFRFGTEASINLSDDEELMQSMVSAGFNSVFVGIETPNEDSLAECNKLQNKNRDLVASINKIQRAGMEVTGGFIVGFDNDPPSIFDRMTEMIQQSGVVTAMVGLLNAPRGTRLHQRLETENRLLKNMSGNNTDFSTNFIPKMNYDVLIEGYRKIINGIYSPKPYYQRVKRFLKENMPSQRVHFSSRKSRLHFEYAGAFFKSLWLLGIKDRARTHYWKLFFWSLFRHPQLFPAAITFSIYGYHFRKVFEIR